MPSGAAGTGGELVALDQNRVLLLQTLDRQVARVGDVRLHAIEPIFRCPCPESAADRLQVGVVLAATRIDAGEGDRRSSSRCRPR